VLVAASALTLFLFSAALWLLIAPLAVFGLCLGTAITTAYAAGGAVIPRDAHATSFGFLTSASMTGVAISPVLSGLLGARSIRAVFIAGAVVLGVLAIVVRRVMVERNPPMGSTPAIEES
jgi:MFS family permease